MACSESIPCRTGQQVATVNGAIDSSSVRHASRQSCLFWAVAVQCGNRLFGNLFFSPSVLFCRRWDESKSERRLVLVSVVKTSELKNKNGYCCICWNSVRLRGRTVRERSALQCIDFVHCCLLRFCGPDCVTSTMVERAAGYSWSRSALAMATGK